ncbi:MAG: hypothetical protein U0790_07225 [Isosphaeraceae bacterium]
MAWSEGQDADVEPSCRGCRTWTLASARRLAATSPHEKLLPMPAGWPSTR